MRKRNRSFIDAFLSAQERKDRQALKDYCEEQGYPQDYENIVLPLLNAYGWEILVNIGEIEWLRVGEPKLIDDYKVTYLNLDRLSTLVEWNENKQKFVAVS
jgi:hypothetical protein